VLQPFAAERVILAVVLSLAVAGCGRQDKQLQQHQETLESLGATTKAIAEAWLGGSVSGTYTLTALEQTLILVEQERSAFATVPEALVDPRGARLSQAAERLSRLLAETMGDVRVADSASVRRHMADIPIQPSARK
jgi:hypothetical protein